MILAVFAVLTGLAMFSVLWPLSRRGRASMRDGAGVAFYEAQIAAIQRDAETGLVSAGDAETARTEAARRLLAAADSPHSELRRSRRAALFAALLVMLGVPGVAFGLYQRIGRPYVADAPLAARLAATPERTDVGAIIAKIEAHLAVDPNDGRGYQLIAPIYLRLGRTADAVNAYAKTLQLLGETPERRTDYAEALVAAAQGNVIPEAKAAFEMVLKAQPDLPKARFYLGLAAEQAGDTGGAREIWSKMLADAAPDAPYVATVQERIRGLDRPKGPAADAIAALPASERDSAIRSMVDGLALRLAQKGDDAEGWLRLMRAYNVLHEAERARTALKDARKSMASDAAALERIEKLARELGLEGQ